MLLNRILKYGFLILIFSGALANYSRAQTSVCNLQFEIFDLHGVPPMKPIENVKAVLTNLETKKKTKFSAAETVPSFTNLVSGKYKIEVIKDNFQRRIKEFELVCKTVDEFLTVSKFLYLQKGDVKKVVEFESKVYDVVSEKGQYEAKSDKSNVGDNAVTFIKPKYPAAARAVRASGTVQVQVTIDEDGEVIAASAISGHPLLRAASESAASETRFAPTLLSGVPVQVTGIINYNFNP